ncbi:MAG: hypothetical protein K5697_08960 [Lachnospiraceae bacterium]|nr:hypothetical protein [Lachnospiraceae bacterium]
MAYKCLDCDHVFSTARNSCPYCGGKVIWEVNDSSEHIPEDSGCHSDNFTIRDEDLLASLRRAYEKEHGNTTNHHAPEQTYSSANSASNQSASPSNEDFFSQFRDASTPSEPVPTIFASTSNHSSLSHGTEPLSDERETELDRVQRRIHRQNRRDAILRFLSSINRRTLFRTLGILCIVILAASIWIQRESILHFLLQNVLPIVLIGYIIYRVFRQFFRRW